MNYSIKQMADIAKVSVRTLHHYDHVGLLKPARVKSNKYRVYEEKELLKLQQILFFKELNFPLLMIRKIINSENFDIKEALNQHKKMLVLKQKRISELTKTIDRTIKRINNEIKMKDEELYNAFKEHDEKYADEAKAKWGNTDAYKQSVERVSKLSKQDIAKIQKSGDLLLKEIVLNMKRGPGSIEVQKLIGKHYNGLRTFYEPSFAMYRGLADMYVSDPRFTAYYEKYATGLASFMRDAMHIYADQNE